MVKFEGEQLVEYRSVWSTEKGKTKQKIEKDWTVMETWWEEGHGVGMIGGIGKYSCVKNNSSMFKKVSEAQNP